MPSSYPLATNASNQWPEVRIDPALCKPERFEALVDAVADALQAGFTQRAAPVKVAAVHRVKTLDDGFLYVPIMLNDADLERWVFVFPETDDQAGAQFDFLQGLCQRKSYLYPVYYAPLPLRGREPESPLLGFDPALLTPDPDLSSAGQWALWWSDPRRTGPLDDDPGIRALGSAFRSAAGIESYVLAHFFRTWGLLTEEIVRLPLPEREAVWVCEGPDAQRLLVAASREKGLRINFDVQRASATQRDYFLKHLAAYFEQLKQDVVREGLPLDDSKACGAFEWWQKVLADAKATPAGEEVRALGLISAASNS